MQKKYKLGTAALLAAGATLAVTALGSVSANADPTSTPRTYVAVGSDTIQDLYNSFGNGYTDGSGTAQPAIASISSYNATDPNPPVPPVPPEDANGLGSVISPTNSQGGACGTIGRPNGSGDGRKFLSAAWNPNNHQATQTVNFPGPPPTTSVTTYTVGTQCIDIARASGKPSATLQNGEDDLTSVPLARDAVSAATEAFTFTFTEPELQSIYGAPDTTAAPDSADGVYTQVAGKVTVGDIQRDTSSTTAEPTLVTGVNPAGTAATTTQSLIVLLPQPQSGTRQFFQAALGNINNTTATWVNDNNEENHVSALTNAGPGAIIPFSAAQYIAQFNGIAGDTGLSTDPNFNLNSLRVGVNDDGTGGTVEAPANISDGVASPGLLFGNVGVVPDGAVGTFNRDVYSVVPSVVITPDFTADPEFADTASNVAYAAAIKTLVTVTLPTSANITAFGFEQISYSATPGNWIHSAWEN